MYLFTVSLNVASTSNVRLQNNEQAVTPGTLRHEKGKEHSRGTAGFPFQRGCNSAPEGNTDEMRMFATK